MSSTTSQNLFPAALILNGSASQNSHTSALSQSILDSLSRRRVHAKTISLVSTPLPFADPAFHRNPIDHPDSRVKQLVEQADRTHIFVLLTPIYHNSYSALLKNSLDHLAIKQFAGKIVGLGSHGGNRSTQAVDHLRIVSRGLNAIAIPTQVCTDDSDYRPIDGGYVVYSETILERIERFADELTALCAAVGRVPPRSPVKG